jgi:hypothetical protein
MDLSAFNAAYNPAAALPIKDFARWQKLHAERGLTR